MPVYSCQLCYTTAGVLFSRFLHACLFFLSVAEDYFYPPLQKPLTCQGGKELEKSPDVYFQQTRLVSVHATGLDKQKKKKIKKGMIVFN